MAMFLRGMDDGGGWGGEDEEVEGGKWECGGKMVDMRR